MGVDEGGLQYVIDHIEVIILVYDTNSLVALSVFVIHTTLHL